MEDERIQPGELDQDEGGESVEMNCGKSTSRLIRLPQSTIDRLERLFGPLTPEEFRLRLVKLLDEYEKEHGG